MMSEKIEIEGREISIKSVNDQDYISLTDIAKQRYSQRPVDVITSWINNLSSIEFLEVWEEMYNPNFNVGDFTHFRHVHSRAKIQIRVSEFLEHTKAIGIVSKSGRYGGTFAHVDIAFEFASWLSPAFKLKFIKEYQRLRSEEAQRQRLQWNAGRELARLNYPIPYTNSRY